MNSSLFCIVLCICSFDIFISFSVLIHGSREYFLWLVENKSCFWRESFSSLVTWAIYFRCCILQKDEMLVDLVISRSLSLLKTYAQSNPSGSGTISPVFLAAFLAFKYSGGQIFFYSHWRPSSWGNRTKLFQVSSSLQQTAPMIGSCTRDGSGHRLLKISSE